MLRKAYIFACFLNIDAFYVKEDLRFSVLS